MDDAASDHHLDTSIEKDSPSPSAGSGNALSLRPVSIATQSHQQYAASLVMAESARSTVSARDDQYDNQRKQAYILRICETMMMYGAPTYRLEEYMHKAGQNVGLDLQSFYLPGCMILSFRNKDLVSNTVHVVRCAESLNLSKLDDVFDVYKRVNHRKITVDQAMLRIEEILAERNKFPRWLLIPLYGLASAFIGPFSYGARPIDLPVIFILGTLLGLMQYILAERSPLYRHVFEVSGAIMTAFLGRAFASLPLPGNRSFCFSAISQAGLVMILPGFTITNSALELQSKNIVTGAVRMVYAIIIVLFLAFGTMIGTTVYGAMDLGANSATTCETTWPIWWKIIFIAPFIICYAMVNQARWKQIPPMAAFAVIGWVVQHFSALRFRANTQISQAFGALAAAFCANVYSRLGYGRAYSLAYPAIFIQVPGSLGASGGFLAGLEAANQLNDNLSAVVNTNSAPNPALLQAGYAMVEVAIALTVGLSVAALLVYPFHRRWKKAAKSGLFSF